MAIVAVRSRGRHERGFARLHERRTPQAGVSSSVAPLSATQVIGGAKATSAETSAATKLPTNVTALAGAIVVLGLFILAFAIWKLISWRHRRIKTASKFIGTLNKKQGGSAARFEFETVIVDREKPTKPILKPTIPPASAGVSWVPQLRPDISLPQPTRKRSQRAKRVWEKNLSRFMAPTIPEREPPPSYAPRVVPPIPTEALSPPRQALPPTPPATLKLSFDGITLPPPIQKLTSSPARSSSYTPHTAPPRPNERKLPRLMTVANDFDPTMDDELCVTAGEAVRLLEEYEDEWCLIQRVGRIDAEKGAIPRFCLMERPEVVPSHPGLPSAGSYRR